jgi:uncharacterized surface protein with fasciclin (FAS1) repeats
MTFARRTLLLASAAAMAATLAACASMPAPATIADTAARTPTLSTLSKLINDAGLAETLRGAGPYTVFAPSDEAFKAVPAKTLAELGANKDLLRAVLSYHVVPGKLAAADVKNGNLKSAEGGNLAVARSGSFVTVEDAVVTQPDVGATNGVVHIIDKVLMPPKR